MRRKRCSTCLETLTKCAGKWMWSLGGCKSLICYCTLIGHVTPQLSTTMDMPLGAPFTIGFTPTMTSPRNMTFYAGIFKSRLVSSQCTYRPLPFLPRPSHAPSNTILNYSYHSLSLLTRVSRVDPLAGDLAYRTLTVLARVPLDVQDEDTWTVVIGLIARELAYAKCSFQHSWLGIWLLRIVEMSLRVRNLSRIEIRAIKELAVRREE
jgi:hypothetical protein